MPPLARASPGAASCPCHRVGRFPMLGVDWERKFGNSESVYMAVKHPFLRVIALVLALLGARLAWAAAPAQTLDDFSSIDDWSVTASDGVAASIFAERGALRLDVNFQLGAGYAVVHRDLPMTLPENFDIAFDVSTDNLPPNNLELKLVTPATDEGTDVWWVNRRAFHFPQRWERLHSKRRNFEFAWGPSGGKKPLTKIAAIEIAVSSAEGGSGSVWIRNLTLTPLAPVRPYTGTPRVAASTSTSEGWRAWHDAPEDKPLDWHAKPSDTQPWLEIDFTQPRAFGGVILHWAPGAGPSTYRIMTSPDDKTWQTVATVENGDGGTDAAYLPDTEARYLRVEIDPPTPPQGVALTSYEIVPVDEASDRNAFVEHLSKAAPEGWFPEYFAGPAGGRRQCFWTVVGAPLDSNEALVNENGAIEIRKGGPTLEPFIDTPNRLITWADVDLSQSLLDGYLPIPSVTWRTTDGLTLETTVVADGTAGTSRLIMRYRLTNTGAESRQGKLILALRPFQIVPAWQRLNMTGGVSTVSQMVTAHNALNYDRTRGPRALTEPSRVMLARFDNADIVRNLHTPQGAAPAGGVAPALGVAPGVRTRSPASNAVMDPNGLASGAFFFPFALDPGSSTDVYMEVPLHLNSPSFDTSSTHPRTIFEDRLKANADAWRTLLNRTTITVPPSAAHVWNTIRSNLAYILINQDGPAIQPGSRTYERSWIRDGCMTAAALLSFDHPDTVRRYLDWYGSHQFKSGKVPCVVDRRGPDPVNEHDSTGEFLYALWNYAMTTGDLHTLGDNFDRVVKGVDYLRSLRAQRMTPEYADPKSPKHAMYGLLPESISHEGYSAKPMHSYWDDFFALKGLRCAADIARLLHKSDEQERFHALADDFQRSLYDSIHLAMEQRGIDYIPGCVELGDFDPTSTAIAIFPCGQLANMPEPQTRNTFKKYWDRFEARRDDTIEWHDYTPYEARIIGALVILGWPDRARGLMDWLMTQGQHPAAWNEWAEVAYREARFPGWIGDMPHTWVGAGFINSVVTMLAYHRASDDALVLAAGVAPEWLVEGQGVGVKSLHTVDGTLGYHLSQHGAKLTLVLDAGIDAPPGGIVLHVPGDRDIASATVDGKPVKAGDHREIRFDHAPARVEVVFQE